MATVKFYLKHPKAGGTIRTDEVTISAKFTLSRAQRFEIKTEEKVLPKFWDGRAQCVKSNCRDHIGINLYLQDFKRNLITLYRENQKLSFEQFRELVRKKPGDDESKSFWPAWEKYTLQCEQDKDHKTVQKISALATHLKKYQTEQRRELDFKHIEWNFYDSFRSFLYESSLVDSSVYKYIAILCTFLRWAAIRTYPVNPVFSEWKLFKRIRKPVSLSIDELEKLELAILPKGPSVGRDFLVFESRTGQRISDIMRFNLKDFRDNQWTFFRKKGNSIKTKQVAVHFVGYCEPALRILERHNFSLPKMSEQKINENIKKALEIAGITSPVTIDKWRGGKCELIETRKCDIGSTHMGRRTFITLALQYMPPKIVKDLAGIDSYQTLKHYEGNSEAKIIQSHLTAMGQQIKAG